MKKGNRITRNPEVTQSRILLLCCNIKRGRCSWQRIRQSDPCTHDRRLRAWRIVAEHALSGGRARGGEEATAEMPPTWQGRPAAGGHLDGLDELLRRREVKRRGHGGHDPAVPWPRGGGPSTCVDRIIQSSVAVVILPPPPPLLLYGLDFVFRSTQLNKLVLKRAQTGNHHVFCPCDPKSQPHLGALSSPNQIRWP